MPFFDSQVSAERMRMAWTLAFSIFSMSRSSMSWTAGMTPLPVPGAVMLAGLRRRGLAVELVDPGLI